MPTAIVYEIKRLTIIDLLQRDLRILWQALLRSIRQHEGFRLLRRRHRCVIVLRVHGYHESSGVCFVLLSSLHFWRQEVRR